jgi:superfamily II DNA helicase RecQ
MKLKAMTLRWGEDGFETAALDRFVADHDIVGTTEHFFTHAGEPCWALLLTYRPRASQPVFAAPTGGTAQEPPRLAPEEQAVYEALRKWRNDRARAEGKPPYVLFTNGQMAALARTQPRTLTALREVYGIGEAKVEAFGAELVALMNALQATPADPSGPPAPAGGGTHGG